MTRCSEYTHTTNIEGTGYLHSAFHYVLGNVKVGFRTARINRCTHLRNITAYIFQTSSLRSLPYSSSIHCSVEFDVLTTALMTVAIFWETAPCRPYMNRRFGGTYHPSPSSGSKICQTRHQRARKNWLRIKFVFRFGYTPSATVRKIVIGSYWRRQLRHL